MLWCVHNPDGSKQGPLDTKALILGLQSGEVSGAAWVRRPEDKRWQPVSSYEAFSEIADPEGREAPRSALWARMVFACCAVLFAFVVGVTALSG